MRIDESFNIKNGRITGRDGKIYKIAYIDPRESEGTYVHKDVIKNRYHGSWLKNMNTWGWFLGDNPENVYRTQIKPCLEYLEGRSTRGPRKSQEEIISIIDDLIRNIDSSESANQEVPSAPGVTRSQEAPANSESSDEIKARLTEFKQQLMDTVSSEDFANILEPILRFKRAQGHQVSLGNAILIYLQDPDAICVKSKSNWKAVNRTVKPDAPAISLWVPKGTPREVNKEQVKSDFLASVNKRSIKDLTPGEKEELKIKLHPIYLRNFDLEPKFYDYRYTEQMPGKEDLIGDPHMTPPEREYNENETEESVNLIEATKRVIEKARIRVIPSNNLNGEKVASNENTIYYDENAPRNTDMLSLLIREFAHEVLHNKFLKNNGKAWAEYFVGNENGKEAVNRQAEMVSWFVMKYLGYNMRNIINYAGMWGLDRENAPFVFDSVASVSSDIYKNIMKEYENGENDYDYVASDDEMASLSESIINEKPIITGRQIAEMLGFEKIYDQAKKAKLNEVKSKFNKAFKKICNPINY